VFTKYSAKNPKPTFSRCFAVVFGRFLVMRVKQQDKKNIEKKKS
jgi:hypothetical protein